MKLWDKATDKRFLSSVCSEARKNWQIMEWNKDLFILDTYTFNMENELKNNDWEL